MWKSTAKTLVIALSFTTFGTGCELQDVIDFLVNIQPPTPPIPTPIEPCEEELEQCLDSGIDEDFCYQQFDVCFNPEPPPVDDCELQLDECLGQYDALGPDPSLIYPVDCYEQYEECIDEPPPVDTCEQDLEDCLDGFQAQPDADFWDPNMEECYVRYDECVGPPPVDPCDEQLDECLDGDGEWDFAPDQLPPGDEGCWDQYYECVEPPPVDECDEQLEECLNSFGQDPVTDEDLPYWDPNLDECYVAYDECQGWNPPPPPEPLYCEEEFEQCTLQDQYTWEECEDQFGQCLDDWVTPMPEPAP